MNSNITQITKIFFLKSCSVSFVFTELIDLKNKCHFSTKMLIIAINFRFGVYLIHMNKIIGEQVIIFSRNLLK